MNLGAMSATGAGTLPPRRAHWADAISALLYRRHGLWLAALLLPPLLWFGIIYLGSLLSLLAHSFFRLDDYSGLIVYEIGISNFVEIFAPANLDVAFRTTLMAVLVTLACTVIAFPIAYYMARYARGATKALFYVAVMLPLWSSYLVRLYAWKLLLAKEGAISWFAQALGVQGALDALLGLPVVGGHSLSFSPLGTFIVFVFFCFFAVLIFDDFIGKTWLFGVRLFFPFAISTSCFLKQTVGAEFQGLFAFR